MKFKKLASSALAAILLAGGSIVLAASSAHAASCSAFANNPYKLSAGYGSAVATAGRSNCSGAAVKVEAWLYHYQPHQIHESMDSTSRNAVNYSASLSWARPNTATANGWDWFSEAKTSTGQTAKSGNVRLWT